MNDIVVQSIAIAIIALIFAVVIVTITPIMREKLVKEICFQAYEKETKKPVEICERRLFA